MSYRQKRLTHRATCKNLSGKKITFLITTCCHSDIDSDIVTSHISNSLFTSWPWGGGGGGTTLEESHGFQEHKNITEP